MTRELSTKEPPVMGSFLFLCMPRFRPKLYAVLERQSLVYRVTDTLSLPGTVGFSGTRDAVITPG